MFQLHQQTNSRIDKNISTLKHKKSHFYNFEKPFPTFNRRDVLI